MPGSVFRCWPTGHAEGVPITDKISLVLTDLEMPEMDGFT
jgi:CheY-like chemotaxis protein